MKLQLDDVVRVKEDLQFHYTTFDKIVGETFKVTTVINDHSVLVQRCTPNGAVTHSRTKRVKNPDMDFNEFTDYYEVLKRDGCGLEYGETTPVGVPMISDEKLEELVAHISASDGGLDFQSGGVWYGPHTNLPDFEDPYEEVEEEYTGGSSSYYSVFVEHPTTEGRPQYMAECNDIIEALGMNYAEGNAFKALWRRAAARNLGKRKKGYDNGLYDSEKVEFFGIRLKVQSKVEQEREDQSSLL